MLSIFAGNAVAVVLMGCGLVLTVRYRFFPLRRAGFIWRNTVGTLFERDGGAARGISPFQAVTTALAGTMGVGNIAGVATALVAGGAGSIFWMWVSALLGMSTKYAEIYLAVRYRKKGKNGYIGGPMYYIRDGMGSGRLAVLYAVLCVLTSFGIGNLAQSNAVAQAMLSSFSIPLLASGCVVALAVGLVVFGGIRRIARVTEWLIPFMSILYICFSGVFLYQRRAMLPPAFALIFAEAFAPRSALGGAAGYGIAAALRVGLARGVFTNEAGLGSASIAHAAADCESPSKQAAWGVFEVFLDTMVVCTITALVLLCAEQGALWQSGRLDGAALTAMAFESGFPGMGGRFVAVSIAVYAIAAMLGWCYYGQEALAYLGCGRAAVLLYRGLFTLCCLLGAIGRLAAVWQLSDLLNVLMALPNVLALLALAGEVKTP